MIQEKTNCNKCNVSIADKTKIKCEGLCMPCYMQGNYGFKPSQIESIKRRGLTEIAIKWTNLVHQGIPNIRNPLIATKAQKAIPMVYSAVNSYLHSETKKFDGNSILKSLTELRSLPNDELHEYLSEVERFIMELKRTAKS